ncbi:MAG: ribosome small subunit-dependent GTPase A, partial [Oscillospiraceae bacterium]|nr:ribosome small subunit-dependent GTPase A [Oscillospiraceae bacterium]
MTEGYKGRIVKALSGFYYVRTEEGTVTQCRARGIFRKEGITPLVGDWVEISRQGKQGTVEKIAPRKNSFVRPAVSNLDVLVVLASEANPVTDPFLIDRVSAIAGQQNVPVVLCVNKTDLKSGETLLGIYRRAGFLVFATSAQTGEGVQSLRQAIAGRTVAFTGNSGVGKSSILNCINGEFAIPTGEVSDKLGRGRHTTRHVELYTLPDGTCIMDTPGFSSFDTEQMERILKEDLQYAFPDFAPYLGTCRYHDCAHIKEPDCAVRKALEEGFVERSRYESYVRLYEEARKIRFWEMKTKEKVWTPPPG